LNRAIRPGRYQAPSENGAKLVVPPEGDLPALALANRRLRNTWNLELFGKTGWQLAEEARSQLFEEARRYTAAYLPGVPLGPRDAPLVMTGHQPGFVHPGVWFKNFAASRVAARGGSTAVNLIIDADLARSSAVRVPAGETGAARVESVLYDQPGPVVPWEERRVVDQATWDTFAERASSALSWWIPSPMVRQWWPSVLAQMRASDHLPGMGLARARHVVESQWGAPSLELPQSRLCQLPSFRWVVLHLLVHLDAFRAAYNGALATYRVAGRIRSTAHPAPDLGVVDDWQEAPLWIWSGEHPQRRAVYVRRSGAALEVTDRARFSGRLPIGVGSSARDVDDCVSVLARWEEQGVRVRSRALITTLVTRMFFADLFLHGIGGAHYDQVTNDLGARFYGLAPPDFAVLSGTLRLPIAASRGIAEDVREAGWFVQRLRSLRYHPEVHLGEVSLSPAQRAMSREVVARKRRWIESLPPGVVARTRHQGIESANRILAGLVAEECEATRRAARQAAERRRQNALLSSRDYAFCLFPVNELRRFLLDLFE
jgi:hypothetical protein